MDICLGVVHEIAFMIENDGSLGNLPIYIIRKQNID